MEKRPPESFEQELRFKPVTEGLGFHPFSDGLPYAPITKTSTKAPVNTIPNSISKAAQRSSAQRPNYSRGAGAIAAGPALPARPILSGTLPAVPRISVPVATAIQSPGTATGISMSAGAPSPTPAIELKTVTEAIAAIEEQSRFGWSYPVKRIIAYLLDSALNISLCLAALSVSLWKANLNPEMLFAPGVALLAAVFLLGFNWALIAAEEVAFGTSLGKRVFGLVLNGSLSATLLRSFLFLPSLAFCGVGLLWAVFDKKRRCWHDVAVDLQPMEIARL